MLIKTKLMHNECFPFAARAYNPRLLGYPSDKVLLNVTTNHADNPFELSLRFSVKNVVGEIVQNDFCSFA